MGIQPGREGVPEKAVRMHIFLWLGMFFICGGIFCVAFALQMRYGKHVREVEAEVVSVREPEEIVEENRRARRRKKDKEMKIARTKEVPPEPDGKDTEDEANDPEEVEDTLRETVFEFELDGEPKRVAAHISAKAEVGEKGKMYYDVKTGLIYSSRVFVTLWCAAGVFAASGVLTILLDRVLTR